MSNAYQNSTAMASTSMSFGDAVRTVVQQKYATFEGRARRAEYWWFFLFNILLSVGVSVVGGVLAALAGQSGGAIISMLAGFILLVVSLGLLIPGIAVSARRLHDRGWSAWWLLGFLVPILNLVLIVNFFMRGTVGPNKFGPDPLGGA